MTEAKPKVEIYRQDDFSSIWLKYVRGVDLSVHCINSLIGERHHGISLDARLQTLELDQHPLPLAFYLCAVSTPYNWQRNAHLAFVAAPGETWTGEAAVPGMRIRLTDAAPILGWGLNSIDPEDPNANVRLFKTCRNWQFAHELRNRLHLTSRKNHDTRSFDPAQRRVRKPVNAQPTLGI